jgi:hypothetical protein
LKKWLRALGIVALALGIPTIVFFGACVSYRDICEGAGGDYAHNGTAHLCSFPEQRQEGCPHPYEWRRHDSGCFARSRWNGAWRWSTW